MEPTTVNSNLVERYGYEWVNDDTKPSYEVLKLKLPRNCEFRSENHENKSKKT